MRMPKPWPVREVVAEEGPRPSGWPFTMAPVRQLLDEGLELGPATVLVGENGAGKSTLVEAVAVAYGLSPEGGSTGAHNSTRVSESPLHEQLRLVRGAGASRSGYFLRAETTHGLLTYLEQNPNPFRRETAYHELSHGQAFDALLSERLVYMSRGGLLVLDEPEAGLSFTSQLRLVQQLAELPSRGIQVLLATHSPVVAALPGARILQVDEDGFSEVGWGQLATVDLHRRFLDHRQRFLDATG